ncbi:hypothetical protein ES288_D11G282400v1 [Gossypium darwinii]|uniref:Uncharacterized protein n=2 Tax=Gossypium TaxID=3633 RepID=A0A5D2AST2_GOSDA|nr:hypothetical protein ES288_D11G282400v1 [Gossypium darwinii]TYG46766.1 hypothetical protein ES288_D11G282400v1 [Gossypium darwinii]
MEEDTRLITFMRSFSTNISKDGPNLDVSKGWSVTRSILLGFCNGSNVERECIEGISADTLPTWYRCHWTTSLVTINIIDIPPPSILFTLNLGNMRAANT